MMGKDIEAIVSGIDAVKKATVSAIQQVASGSAYQLKCKEQHGGISTGECLPKEEPVPLGDVVAPISAALGAMSGSCGKMKSMGSSLYTGASSFNNSIGSPWSEISDIEEAVGKLESYSSSASPLNYVGDKAGMLGMLNMILSLCVDTKWAIITYHDFVQRGFDSMFNGNTASVTYTSGLNGKQSIGNIDQQFDENVHIPQPSIDPY